MTEITVAHQVRHCDHIKNGATLVTIRYQGSWDKAIVKRLAPDVIGCVIASFVPTYLSTQAEVLFVQPKLLT